MRPWRPAGLRAIGPRPLPVLIASLPAALSVLMLLIAAPARSASTAAPPARPDDTAAALPATTSPGAEMQVHGRATWDDDYLYFAVQVDDSDVIGTNTSPLSHPENDDSIGVYLRTGGDHPSRFPDASTHAMLVSAAGGFTFLRGDADSKAFVLQPLFTIKYAVTIQGTLNREGDRDHGYTVELAIPLQALGLDPKNLAPGTTMAVDIVARSRGGKPPFTASAPDVHAEEDLSDPGHWGRLVLAAADGSTGGAGIPSGHGTILSPRVGGPAANPRPPLIDGIFTEGEWPDTSSFTFAAPGDKPAGAAALPNAPTAQENDANDALAADEAARDATAPALPLTNGLTGLQTLVFARYSLQYQGDAHKTIPARGVLTGDGAFLLRDQPLTGAGPWFSTDRVGWHRTQMAEMRQSGIDVALTEVGGGGLPEGLGDEKALLTLVTALHEMAIVGERSPQLALYLCTDALVPDGSQIDLATDDGRATLYAAIRRWMQIVAPDLRARVTFQPPTPSAATAAYPIFLSSGAVFAHADDAGWADDIRRRFAADFGQQSGGATLLFVGGAHFNTPAAAASLAAVIPAGTTGPSSGPVKAYVIQPGYDKAGAALVPRRDAATYRESWEAALAAHPSWYILDSWNDFTRGTELAPSRQYGTRYEDETLIYTIQIEGLRKRDVRWLRCNAPRRIRPGDIVQTEVTFENAGSEPLRPSDGIVLTYRWRRPDGTVAAESPIHIPLQDPLLPTRSTQLSLGLGAVSLTNDGRLEPLEPGDYTVDVDLAVQSPGGQSVTYFADGGSSPLSVPVTVTPDIAASVQFESTTTPALLRAGGTYPVQVRVRWTGTAPLPAGSAALTYQFQSADGTTTYGTGSVPLDEALAPGQWVTLTAPLQVTDSGGQPLAPANPEAANTGTVGTTAVTSYSLRWILTRTSIVATIPGEYRERVAVYPGDPAARFITPLDIPATMNADALVPLTVQVVNDGQADWAPGKMALGYHWYYPDGVEEAWTPSATVLVDRPVRVGQTVRMTVLVRCPDRDGEYVLAFDALQAPNGWLSTLPVSQPGDLGLARVRISGGRLTFVDLSKWTTLDGVASEANPGDGDLDGAGDALPAESFPPDLYGLAAAQQQLLPTMVTLSPGEKPKKLRWEDVPAYPANYYVDISPSARLVSFRYGSDTDGAKNVVSCTGQTIPVPHGSYSGLHLAATAIGGQAHTLMLALRYRDGSTVLVSRSVGDWLTPPAAAGDPVALVLHRVRRKDGDKPAECYIRHVILPLAITRDLVSITLPQDPDLKVFAMTLQK